MPAHFPLRTATMDPIDYDDTEETGPSKSERKRQMHALQKLGRELAEMPDAQRAKFTLSEDLHHALDVYNRIRQGEGRRRQLQYIGKAMRKLDQQLLEQELEAQRAESALTLQASQEADEWRNALIDGDKTTLEAFIEHCPGVDIQRLRQLTRQCQKEKAGGKPPANARKLFELVRDALNAQ